MAADVDVTVVGGGQGGIYDAYRFAAAGLSVIGLEGGSDFGGVWYNNRYPGARIDSDSLDYCFQFSKDIFASWQWYERYADADTLYRYLTFVADKLNVRHLFQFNTWLRSAQWSKTDHRWHLETNKGDQLTTRFLVMASGVLSTPKPASLPGIERFKGEWIETSRWHDREISLRGRRIGIIGTGSSGVQVIPFLARGADHLYVFQRHPHYAVPAQNRPNEPGLQDSLAENLDAHRQMEIGSRGPGDPKYWQARNGAQTGPRQTADSYSPKQRREMFETQWAFGGHAVSYLFSDATTNLESNDIVAGFVREKIRERVNDPVVAEKLSPRYPIGTRRLILEIDYYESYNQDNVSLVDVLEEPIIEITPNGVRTKDAHYDIDLLVLALGFQSFIGPLSYAGIRNDGGLTFNDLWSRGPRTLFGLMTPGMPNLFHPTSAGSPSVLGNAMLQHEFFGDWMADCVTYLDNSGQSTIEAADDAAESWTRTVDQYAQRMLPLRRSQNQYMVHVNEDGSRLYIPFCGGMGEYSPKLTEATARGYEGFELS